ncbi:MAG TPA: class I SAM-dependent methyltransferase [Chthoniobacterales bacterium]|nr:class I SAM-dependent methyltransferase [Chthoniobacterales bacterium]
MTSRDSSRSRAWKENPHPRYWWHRLPGNDYVPPVYSDLSESEWTLLREWYGETDGNGPIGECAVPLISLLHGIVMGNRAARIAQLGTCAGYSALLLGWMLRRMDARRGLFSLDFDPAMCELARRWIARAELQDFVEIAEGNSLEPTSIEPARKYLGGDPELIILDSSHEYRSTSAELDLWYGALAPGGLLVLHDVSEFAAGFDVTSDGGVHRALSEWRKAHPEAETLSLNSTSRSMEESRPLYKDACGVGLIHKPQHG